MAIAPPKYHEGSFIELKAEFRDLAGVLANPSTITLKYRKPDGVITTIAQGALSNPSAGIWTYNLDTTGMPLGLVHYKFYGTGSVKAAGEEKFDLISPSGFSL